ncbi:hypothetical protein UNDKW_4580 [Undibacterium sp. KW1]|uniref:hypothetical protein n=1 Tax=Undibacterium sp. KW1 TaxID=2058624 RepID=UPI001331EDCD|nr:hypothetical protein [Undibacterium sp. KW1]BBB62853.1 hypothetical protein UNDKW_4580 [Undibacterium sp. KW1]
MKLVLYILATLLTPLTSSAACSGEVSGKSHNVAIEISDRGCEYSSVHIFFGKKNGEEGHFPVEEECTGDGDQFSCKANSRTPLAGKTYRLQKHGRDACDATGKTPGERFKCIKGCTKTGDAPMYLYITPYEC